MPKSFAKPIWPHNGSPYGTHASQDRPHVDLTSNPMWDPCQSHLQNPSGPHNGSPYGAYLVPERSHVGLMSKSTWDPCQSHLQNPYGSHNGSSLGSYTGSPRTSGPYCPRKAPYGPISEPIVAPMPMSFAKTI